ncbi:ABC transporter substrate-binding protein [Streptomyces sp. JNUCC 63]
MKSSLARRLILLGSALALTLGTACSSGGSGGSETAAKGATLKVVTPTEPVTMNPVHSVISDARVWGAIMDPLVDVDESGAPLDTGLITSWKQKSPTSWELTVREGVKFSNGEPFDASAVVFSIEQNRTDKAARLASYLSVVKKVTAVDAKTVSVTTNEPYNALPQLLSVIYAHPPKYYKEQTAEGYGKKPVGTGGFTLESYTPGREVVVAKNTDYWRGEPKVGKIVFTWAPDPASRMSLLQTGAADIAIDVPVEQLPALKADPKLVAETKTSTSEMAVFFETGKKPFDDPDLRRAAAMAIDRKALVTSLFRTEGAEPQPHLIGQLMSALPEHDDAIEYDPQGAKKLLDGRSPKITFSYTVGRYPQDAKVGEAVAGMLEKVGFKVKRNPLDVAKFFELRPTGAFEAYMYQISPVFLQPDVYVHGFLTSNSITKHCVDPKLDALSAEALKAPTQKKSEEVYADLEHYALHEKVCNVPLYDVVGIYGVSKKVSGFEAPRDLLPHWPDVAVKG